MADAFEIRYRPAGRGWRKVSFEPRADGWERSTYRWNGCQWVFEGSELVEEIAIETGAGEADAKEVSH